jgi:hypothetical protein
MLHYKIIRNKIGNLVRLLLTFRYKKPKSFSFAAPLFGCNPILAAFPVCYIPLFAEPPIFPAAAPCLVGCVRAWPHVCWAVCVRGPMFAGLCACVAPCLVGCVRAWPHVWWAVCVCGRGVADARWLAEDIEPQDAITEECEGDDSQDDSSFLNLSFRGTCGVRRGDEEGRGRSSEDGGSRRRSQELSVSADLSTGFGASAMENLIKRLRFRRNSTSLKGKRRAVLVLLSVLAFIVLVRRRQSLVTRIIQIFQASQPFIVIIHHSLCSTSLFSFLVIFH